MFQKRIRFRNHRKGASFFALFAFLGLVSYNFHRPADLTKRLVSTTSLSQIVSTALLENDDNGEGFLRFGENQVAEPLCTDPSGSECRVVDSSAISTLKGSNVYTCDHKCSNHASCYFGTCLCHPGYEGSNCEQKMQVANPWYTADCPNLQDDNTLDVNSTDLGGNVDCSNAEGADLGTGLAYCAYLCYSNEFYGSAIVPHALWQKAQEAENNLWARIARGRNDRYQDHFQGFAKYQCVPPNLGHVVEFGAGPWTQLRGLLNQRPDVQVKSYTVLEPGADFYIQNVNTCVYKTGKLQMYPDWSKSHDFPVHIQSSLGESAMATNYQFDTVLVVNVIEHVQNAVDFLNGIHKSLKPGGLLIFHDRYYSEPEAGDQVLGRNVFHPIRLTKPFFDHFLSDFDILFNNCHGETTIRGWMRRNAGERGYYVIARKKMPPSSGVGASKPS